MRKRHTIKYPILKDEEILLMLEEYLEANKNLYTDLKSSNPCLFNNIYNKTNENGIPKGCQRLYYYLDKIYGEEFDYSYLLKKCSTKYYWTDRRICKIINSYIEKNDDLLGFHKNNHRVIQTINRKHPNEGIDYYLQLIGLNVDSDICNSYKNGFWTLNKAVEEAKKIYEEYGYLSEHIWKESGYSETPLSKYSLTKIKSKLDYCSTLEGRDGKNYRSLREVFVANLLWYMDIAYLSDTVIDHSYYRALRYDFYLINYDIYVEIWGFNNKNKKYTADKEEKIKLYKNNRLKLIEISFELFNSYNSFKYIALNIIQKLEANGITIESNEFAIENVFKKTSYDFNKMKMNILNSLAPYIYKRNVKKYLPSEEELKNSKEYSLIIALKRLGGFKEAAIKLDLLPKCNMKGIEKKKKWTEEKIIIELLNTLKNFNLKYFPLLERLKLNYNPALGAKIRNTNNYNLIIEKIKKTEYIPTFDEYFKLEDYNLVVEKLNNLNNDFGFIPNKKHLYDIDNSYNFYNKLRKHFNGYVNAAHKFGFLTEKEYYSLSIK